MLVDVILPVQRADHLDAIIEGFESQSFDDFTVYVVGMSMAPRPLPANMKWVDGQGTSLSGAKNLGLLQGTSLRVLMHTDDAIPGQQHVEAHMEFHNRLSVCYGSYHVVESLERLNSYLPDPRLLREKQDFLSGVMGGEERWKFALGCYSLPRKIVLGLGGFRAFASQYVDDADLARRAVNLGCDVRLLPRAGVYAIKAPVLDDEGLCEAEIRPLYEPGNFTLI